ncbi:hypothetical protein [Enterobacter hormaechei]|uniref:hypothetical protein n=1 Tax=Enterobacter hormaechei TaxID=158836 RepID=UPI0034E2D8D4
MSENSRITFASVNQAKLPFNLVLQGNEGTPAGTIKIDKELVTFEGNFDESAQVFIEHLARRWSQQWRDLEKRANEFDRFMDAMDTAKEALAAGTPLDLERVGGCMKVEKLDVLSFVLTDLERLDPVRVMIENYEPGKGRVTITCYGKAWTAAWFALGGDDVQTFIKRVSDDYLIGCLAPQLRSTVGDDNDANLIFVKSEIIKLRREREIDAETARNMWDEAENADDVKESCCCFGVGNELLSLFGDEPWYAGWPTVPNPAYQYLERMSERYVMD